MHSGPKRENPYFELLISNSEVIIAHQTRNLQQIKPNGSVSHLHVQHLGVA
jgi:hypothetical protein